LISRPNLLTTITVRVPNLRVPIWLPLLSLPLWALTVLAGLVVCFLPRRVLERRMRGASLPVSPVRLGLWLMRLANVLLWSGSFTLCDVHVANEGVHVRIRMI
jgi:hypothetical protein